MSTPDRLGIALFEAKGRTLPPDISPPAPRYLLRCSDCAKLLGEVVATSQGGLLWSKTQRVRATVTDIDTGVERMERTSYSAAFLLDEATDDGVQVRCPACGWRQVGPIFRLNTLYSQPPADGVLPLIAAESAVP